jgi:putative ABC transport system ATP-binding protein
MSDSPAVAGPSSVARRIPRPVIIAQNIQHFFGAGPARKQVLYDNKLLIMPGEVVIMTGPSGSGKTTLLTLIGALRTVQEGQLQVLGRELSNLSRKQLVEVRRDIGFIFQAHNLFPSITASQNVQMALELKERNARQRRQRAVELLDLLGLGHRVNYKPEAMSGGQKQRVAIARALANKPRLILADEPTAALDEKSGRLVVTLLQDLSRSHGCTSLIVTHDNRILDVADRIVNMVDGRIRSNVFVKESVVVCEFLRRLPTFASLMPAALTEVAEKMTKREYVAGTVIFRQGDVGDKFYVIYRGSVDVIIDDGTPSRRLAPVLKEGDHFGEVALLTDSPRSATVVAREDVVVFSLGKDDFTGAVAGTTSFKEQLYSVYFQRLA